LIRFPILAVLLMSLALGSAGAAFTADAPAGAVDAVVTDDKGKPVEDAVVSLTSASVARPAPAAAPSPAIMDLNSHSRQYSSELISSLGTNLSRALPNCFRYSYHLLE